VVMQNGICVRVAGEVEWTAREVVVGSTIIVSLLGDEDYETCSRMLQRLGRS